MAKQLHETRLAGRYVSYKARRRIDDERQFFSDIGFLELVMSQGTSRCMTWKGKPIFKTVYDLSILTMLLWELRPQTVIEIGSGSGASAIWFADMLGVMNTPVKIYSVDLNPVLHGDPRIQFLAGDCNFPNSLMSDSVLKSMTHPLLVVEDAHVNVFSVLSHFHSYLQAGDYLIVEDSAPKQDMLDEFMKEHESHYRVDCHYTDFFGRNATSSSNSILKRV